MKKRLLALVLALVLVLAAVPMLADEMFFFNSLQEQSLSNEGVFEPGMDFSETETPYGHRIYDNADLFTSEEEIMINQRITRFQKETGMDFVVVTYNGPLKKATAQDEADVFYEEGCRAGILGNVEKDGDDEDSGMLLYINPYTGDYHVSTTGKMIDYITDERSNVLDAQLLENLRSARKTDNYAKCVLDLADGVGKYVSDGIPEGQYQYDVQTGQQITHQHTMAVDENGTSPSIRIVLFTVYLLIGYFLF